MTTLPQWVRRRAHAKTLTHAHINRQRRRSLILLLFGVVRITAWTFLGLFVGLGLLHVDGMTWAKNLAESLPFVVLISIYANWATDLDAATAAFAALVASDGHHATETVRGSLAVDFSALEADIARLANLEPCPDATALADDIRRRLTAAGTRPVA